MLSCPCQAFRGVKGAQAGLTNLARLHQVGQWADSLQTAGEMSDASEVLMALYEQLAPVAAKAGQPGLLDTMFGLHVKVCCGSVTAQC